MVNFTAEAAIDARKQLRQVREQCRALERALDNGETVEFVWAARTGENVPERLGLSGQGMAEGLITDMLHEMMGGAGTCEGCKLRYRSAIATLDHARHTHLH